MCDVLVTQGFTKTKNCNISCLTGCRRLHLCHRAPSALHLREPVQTTDVGMQRHDGNDHEVWMGVERLGEDAADLAAPDVLVLDVDQSARLLDRLAVAARHAALTSFREGEVTSAAQVRVGAKQLDDVSSARYRRRRWVLRR